MQSKIKHNAPIVQEIANVKNNVKNLLNIFVIKDVRAVTGKTKAHISQKGFAKCSFSFKCFFIIIKFKMLDVTIHKPMPQTSAYIPIYFGKNQTQSKSKTAPKM